LADCVEVQPKAPGPISLSVTASGLTRTFDFTVKGHHAGHLPDRPTATPVAGHRAAWSEPL
jgi:hypothetical protein